MSLRLSYSLPKSLAVLVNRAMRPSRASATIAHQDGQRRFRKTSGQGGDDGVKTAEERGGRDQVGKDINALARRSVAVWFVHGA